MKRVTISIAPKKTPTIHVAPRAKITIAAKKKILNPAVKALCTDITIGGLKAAINKHIRDSKLQTEQKMYIIVDDCLSGLTGYDTESVHKITEIHDQAINNMYIAEEK